MLNELLYPDLLEFGRNHVSSGDIDPVYPILRNFYAAQGWPEETELWFTMLYLSYYNLGSALRAYALVPTIDSPLSAALNAFPTATERRGLRGGKIVRYLASHVETIKLFGTHKAFFQQGWGKDPIDNYEAFWITFQQVWGNGRWASYKMGEVLQQIHGYNLRAPDLRLEFCSGPKAGLMRMYGYATEPPLKILNSCAQDLKDHLEDSGFDVSWEQLETILCDFDSTCKGHYYVGHDIDLMQEQLSSVDVPLLPVLWQARQRSFPPEYLGELNGWHGVDPGRRKAYLQTKQILVR